MSPTLDSIATLTAPDFACVAQQLGFVRELPGVEKRSYEVVDLKTGQRVEVGYAYDSISALDEDSPRVAASHLGKKSSQKKKRKKRRKKKRKGSTTSDVKRSVKRYS